MSTKDVSKKKTRVLPKPAKRQNIKQALEGINKQYGKTLARLAK